MVTLPISDHTSPARLTLERVTATHGELRGNAGRLAAAIQAPEDVSNVPAREMSHLT